jgi:hypothetical protein
LIRTLTRSLTRPGAAQLVLLSVLLLVWFSIAGVLPDAGGKGDVNTILSDVPSVLLLGGLTLAMISAWDDPLALGLMAVGAGMLAGAATVGDWHAGAAIAKALFGGSVGLLLAWWLNEIAFALIIPLFVSGIDAASVAGGPTQLLIERGGRATDFLSVYLPAVGGGRAGLLGVADLVFVAMYAGWAWRFALRRRATMVALLLSLPVALVVQVVFSGSVPVIPLISAAFLLPNLDLIVGVIRGKRRVVRVNPAN